MEITVTICTNPHLHNNCRAGTGGGVRHLQKVRDGDPEAIDCESAQLPSGGRGQERCPLLGGYHKGVPAELQSISINATGLLRSTLNNFRI